ncbi:MAG: zf-HC2 domain-containing protein [Gemmatimonadaceae bacterium]
MTPARPCASNLDDEVVSRYVAGQLEPAAMEAFEIHLLHCPLCQGAVGRFALARPRRSGLATNARDGDAQPPQGNGSALPC